MLTILQGDCLAKLRELPDAFVHCCVTSPPYWGLRDYGVAGQLGLEKTPEEYVAKMVEVFREVRRVLRDDGTLWLNLGDSYTSAGGGGEARMVELHGERDTDFRKGVLTEGRSGKRSYIACGLKPKDLVGIPWMVAFALRADGWYLRSDIIWHKPNPMPESVTDRPTKAHEYLFLLAKSERYFYDAEAIKEPAQDWGSRDRTNWRGKVNSPSGPQNGCTNGDFADSGRNKRTVWTVATNPYPEAHFATYPPDLIKPCILAGTSAKGCCPKCGAPWERVMEQHNEPNSNKPRGKGAELDANGTHRGQNSRRGEAGSFSNNPALRPSPPKTVGWRATCDCSIESGENRQGYQRLHSNAEKGTQSESIYPLIREAKTVPCTVLDPFGGSGTTGMVALELGRKSVLIELNPEYIELIKQRCNVTFGLPL